MTSIGRCGRRRTDANGRRVRPRRSSINCSVVLPEDVVVNEILVRLPVRSLLRFKCVCRSWHALFSSPGFVESHLQRAKKKPKFLIASLVSNPSLLALYSYDDSGSRSRLARFVFSKKLSVSLDTLFLPPHANGLFLFDAVSELIVCNPSTREHRSLPKGSSCVRTWPEEEGHLWGVNRTGFGFVPSTNTYKLCQYFYRSCDLESGTWSMGFEVFTLGVDSSWRAVEEELPYPAEGSTPMSVGELVYFEIDKTIDATENNLYFSFHLADEKFGTVSLPHGLPGGGLELTGFAELGGRTCFYTLSGAEGTKFDLWVDDGTAKKNATTWTHAFSIELVQRVLCIYPVAVRNSGSLLLVYVLTAEYKFKLMRHHSCSRSPEGGAEVDLGTDLGYYNAQKNKLTCYRHSTAFHVIPYVESLVPIL